MAAEGAYQSGEVLDRRYRLVERLGRGGFGDVWRADELLPDGSALRQVALKLLHSSAAAIPDWSEEARIIASLRHPALVTIYAAGLLSLPEPRPYVAMELLLGDTLAEWVSRGERVPWRRVLSWARAAAAALDEIHRAGVVHLDLKPANLFLAEGGELKVLDFGIARQGRARSSSSVAPPPRGDAEGGATVELDEGEMSTAEFVVARQEADDASPSGTATVTRSVVGTPGFMAPEVLEDAEASRAADAYALAACIVQLATGKLPQEVSDRPAPDESQTRLQGWYAEVQAATVRGKIRDLAGDEAGLPRALVELLERWLALDPVARGLESGSLRAALDEVWRCPHGWTGNPYRGLEPYGIEHEGRLFGRDEDVARISRDLAHQPCVVLHGSDGIGLRSLGLAGVIPQLARSFVDERDDWRPCAIDLATDDPDAALEEALARSGITGAAPAAEPRDSQGEAHGEEPERSGPRRAEALAEGLQESARRSSVGVVVVLNELERVLRAPESKRETLLAWLAIVANQELWPGVRCLATLREEHTPELLRIDRVGAALRPWLRFMGPPPATIATEIVRKPAEASGMRLGDVEVVEQELQRELRSQGMCLPLASLALRAWWEAGEAVGELTGEAWTAQRGMLGALSHHAERVLRSMPEEEQKSAEAVLLRLVASDGSAIEAHRDDLLQVAHEDPERGEAILDALLRQRLVLVRLQQVRLVHPKLADAWPRLHELRLHDMERLAFLEELRESAERWTETGQPRAMLWRGDRLRELARRSDSLAPDLGRVEREFITASRRAATRRRGLLLAQLLGVLLVLVAAYWVSDLLEKRARRQELARQQAERREAIGRMVSESRRRPDPYARVALLAGAMRLGSTDPVLPLELFSTAQPLPHARFLSLRPVARPQFPWDGRWLIGGGSGAVATVFDFEPLKDTSWGPLAHHLHPHPQGMDELVPIAFDSSFVTRGLDGTLKVWRLRLSGDMALAAVSPMACRGGLNAVLVAERAPVLACATSQGIARWDLRKVDEVQTDAFQGRLLHLSPDGAWVAAARLSRLLLWNPEQGRRHDLDAGSAPTLARFSPRDPLVAVIRPFSGEGFEGPMALLMPQALEIYELAGDEPRRLLERQTIVEPADARWDGGGLDIAVCSASGAGQWHYLRSGGRAPDDSAPAHRERPCDRWVPDRPEKLRHVAAYGSLLAGGKRLGPRQYAGGWKLPDGRLLTRDLVLFDGTHGGAAGMLQFVGRDSTGKPEMAGRDDSAVYVTRLDDDHVLWQVRKEIRQYKIDGERLSARQGNVLRRCADHRVLAWRKKDEQTWELFTARHGAHVVDLPREPAFFLGADATCSTVFLQRTNGQLVSLDISPEGRRNPELRSLGKVGDSTPEGYVYDVRPSAGSADPAAPVEPGLWLAFSNGAMVRLEGKQGTPRPYGHATPRPTAMSDGPEPGQLVFADQTGVAMRARALGADRKVLDASSGERWEDIHVAGGGAVLLLASAHRVAVVDVARREVVGSLETRMRGRFAPWDDQGSVLVWSYDFVGPAIGEVLPIGLDLSQAVAEATSNLSARLTRELQVELRAD